VQRPEAAEASVFWLLSCNLQALSIRKLHRRRRQAAVLSSSSQDRQQQVLLKQLVSLFFRAVTLPELLALAEKLTYRVVAALPQAETYL
jgi:hypothetical protein